MKAQKTFLGGKVETVQERIVVTQESFYNYLCDDLEKAKNVRTRANWSKS